jgi:hypothetical protein
VSPAGSRPAPRPNPRGRNGKQRGKAAAAFQLGGWRLAGRAPGAARPPRLGPAFPVPRTAVQLGQSQARTPGAWEVLDPYLPPPSIHS